MNINDAKELFDQNNLSKALEMLDELISKDASDFQALLLRGRIYYKMQHWGESMNDYTSVLEIEPENQEAKSGLAMAKNILGYFTPEMFNP